MLYLIRGFLIFAVLFFTGCSTRSVEYGGYSSNQRPKGEIKSSASMHRATMRPYIVDGKKYYPTVVSVNEQFRGIASWYGKDFHGKKTSNGEYYDMYAMTAAHKTLPMNTMVKVTNLLNGRSEIVRINDRGPFVESRIIDLSYTAAKRLDVVQRGTAPARLEIMGFDHKITTLKGVSKKSVTLGNFAVQIGAFRKSSGADIYKKRYAIVKNRYSSTVKRSSLKGEPIYRVWIEGFKSEEEARDFIAAGEFKGAFIARD